VSNGATLGIFGFGFGITNELLILNGGRALIATTTGTNLWTGPIILNSDSVIQVAGGFRILGNIIGSGGPTFVGSGAMVSLEGSTANSYGGTTTIFGGSTLLLDKTPFDGALPRDLVIGNNTETNTTVVRLLRGNQIANSATVSIRKSGILDLN